MGGTFTKYTIQWFNAITGDLIFSEIQTPSAGDLAMKFPFLSGSAEQPIVFFQVFPEGDASFKTPVDSITEESIAFEIEIPVDTTVTDIKPSIWENTEINPVTEQLVR
ncbi:hypothetical protein JYT72_00060 [Crocinitomix catalasitica]|nr:hypothetical protein [Crocinitomix catalasitica]